MSKNKLGLILAAPLMMFGGSGYERTEFRDDVKFKPAYNKIHKTKPQNKNKYKKGKK